MRGPLVTMILRAISYICEYVNVLADDASTKQILELSFKFQRPGR